MIDDLIRLRRGDGFTAARLQNSPNVIHLLDGRNKTFPQLKATFISAVSALPNRQDIDVLMMALALDDRYKDIVRLTDRREIYGKSVGRKIDTVAERENAAFNELALFLISSRYAASPTPQGIPTIHGAAIHERVDITVLVRDRLWVETRETYRVIPLIDDVDYFEISSDIPANVTAISDVTVKIRTTPNGMGHRFFFEEPLKRGVPVELSFILQPNRPDEEVTALKEETRAFHLPTLAHRMEVVFLGEKPKILWHYSQLPIFERPGIPTAEQIIDLSDRSSVNVQWKDLYGGLYSGIAWEWE